MHLTVTPVLVLIIRLIIQVVPLGLMVDGPREEEEATVIRIPVVEEERRIAGGKEQITIDHGLKVALK